MTAKPERIPFAVNFIDVEHFDAWQQQARRLLQTGTPPAAVCWNTAGREQPSLFGDNRLSGDSADPEIEAERDDNSLGPGARQLASQPDPNLRVPAEFLQLARNVACHRASDRWELLYRTVWRLTNGVPKLLEIETDDDVLRLRNMDKSVRRDAHKMKAFVRFRSIAVDDQEHFVAWHRPDHLVVRLTAPFFSRRFKAMRWSILTPDASAHWDGSTLRYGPGIPASQAPAADELEELWRCYYRSIFNPARVNVELMKREMPVRFWKQLPETQVIDDLLDEAPGRVDRMIASSHGFSETAADYFPETKDLDTLAAAAAGCQACDLCHHATQTVFGEGGAASRVVLVGEQPGDREDLIGRPFVGPAGELLNDALQQAGLRRDKIYLTNTVKHFKHETRGKRRLHKKPDSREIFACRPWLEAELAVIRPQVLVCLGATAAQALIGRDFRITKSRGTIVSTDWCRQTIATWHPSAILRVPDQSQSEAMREQLIDDLRLAASSS